MQAAPPDSESSATPAVSVLVPILNEARYLGETMPPILAQQCEGGLEFLLLDGGSDDGTLEILEGLAATDPRIRVLPNPGRHQSAALNIGLTEARAPLICRMDAHTRYPPGYVQAGVDRLGRGDVAWAAGPAIAVGLDRWSRRVALALSSRLGVGGAGFRLALDREAETDTGFCGVIAAETLREVGGWDEDWAINEDGELAARVRGAGGKIVCIPDMAAEFIARDSLDGLARQYWRYGLGRARTSLRHPGSLRRSHLLPPALVLTLAGALVAPRRLRTACRLALGLYLATLGAESARLASRAGPGDAAWLPPVFATMHLGWGAGFLLGAVRGLLSRSPGRRRGRAA
ncbi:MAG: glycosyltransferase family 2 protein [Solirubrobacterales bacterium]